MPNASSTAHIDMATTQGATMAVLSGCSGAWMGAVCGAQDLVNTTGDILLKCLCEH